MARVIKGRAGREQRRQDLIDNYGSTLAQMLRSHARPDPTDRVLVLGSPGATQIASEIAPRLSSGEVVVVVYTFDELEDAQAALAGIGNVHPINDLADLDEDEPPFDLITCVAPYHLGRDTVIELIEEAVRRLAPGGTLFLAGDKQNEFERYVEALNAMAHETASVAQNGQYRIVSLKGQNVRKGGKVGIRRG